MRATFMYGAGDIRVDTVPDPVIKEPIDADVRVVLSCICGSDLHPYHNLPASSQGTPMGHEFLGVVEELGSQVSGLKVGNLVLAPFAFQDSTCEFCREGCRPRAGTAGSSRPTAPAAGRPKRSAFRRLRHVGEASGGGRFGAAAGPAATVGGG